MGQTPSTPGCQPNCDSETDDTETVVEPIAKQVQFDSVDVTDDPIVVLSSDSVDVTDDREEEGQFQCLPQTDCDTSHHCGAEEDAEECMELATNDEADPQLGSYVSKAPTRKSRGSLRAANGGRDLGGDSDMPGLIQITPQFFSTIPADCRAYKYIPQASDQIDVEVKRNLLNLKCDVSKVLCLWRKRTGIYHIDGRQVTLYWRGVSENGETQELYVHEEVAGSSDANDNDMPLSLYLQQVANVLTSTKMRNAMTFMDLGTDLSLKQLYGKCGSFSQDRDKAMRRACTQAALRESAPFQFGLGGIALKV